MNNPISHVRGDKQDTCDSCQKPFKQSELVFVENTSVLVCSVCLPKETKRFKEQNE